MDNNNFFSFPRIAMVMKREIMENWKTNLYRLIGLYAAFALVMFVLMYNMSGDAEWFDNPDFAFNHFCNGVMRMSIFIVPIASLVYASNIMENMMTKEKRISFLMLPATMIEKFVARFLYVTVGLAVGVVAALTLAEITRYALMPLFNLPDTFYQPALFKLFSWVASMFHFEGNDVLMVQGSPTFSFFLGGLLAIAYGFWIHSLYILGGNYWYKKPFFKTLGMIMLVSIVLAFIFGRSIELMGSDTLQNIAAWFQEHFSWVTLNHAFSFAIAFFSAFTFFNWWLSYKLFTCSQVIKPKFRLL